MSNSSIYTGVWLNWSQGPVLGWTLTLPSTKGQLLIAFLAIFVTTTGARLWIVLSFLIHQLRAAPTPGDGRHQQAQVILRNTSGALDASWELLSLGWPWRKLASSSFWSLFLVALLGSLHASCWVLASIFSSQVTNVAEKEVLIKSPDCGYHFVSKDSKGTTDLYWAQNVNWTTDAASYARLCYGRSNETPFCNQYVVPQLPWTGNTNATCPFSPDFCRLNGAAAAFTMDTGVLSSRSIFGFNTSPSHEIGYRKVTTCAPLRIPKNLLRVVNLTNPDGTPGKEQVARIYLGSHMSGNWTFEYNLKTTSGNGYRLDTIGSFASSDFGSWTPIPELHHAEADVSLYLLHASGIIYHEPVDDEWFSAHSQARFGNRTYYRSDNLTRFLGCTEQHQFCNLNPMANGSSCTPLTGATLVQDLATRDSMKLSDLQLRILSRFTVYLLQTTMILCVNSAISLQAYELLSDTMSRRLPNNQWQIEVTTWFNVALAKLQALLVEISSGPSSHSAGSIIFPPSDEYDQALCSAQKVRQSGNHISFSVIGFTIVLAFGSFIIVLSFSIAILVNFIQRRSRKDMHKSTQWLLDDKLQLQRMIYEKPDVGRLKNCDTKIQTAEREDHIGIIYYLEENDKQHSSH